MPGVESASPGTGHDRRGIITDFAFLGQVTFDKDAKPTTDLRAVLFTAVVHDTNGNGQFGYHDEETLLVGDGAGNGLHAINPPGTQVERMRYDPLDNTLYLLLIADTNGDTRFTQADTSQPYAYTLGDDGLAQPMVDADLIERAESLLR
ncbi:hypothetical protein OT109_08305 [Phycisphaeraceae bacterium D3-23]